MRHKDTEMERPLRTEREMGRERERKRSGPCCVTSQRNNQQTINKNNDKKERHTESVRPGNRATGTEETRDGGMRKRENMEIQERETH